MSNTAQATAQVFLKPRKATPFYHRHPWVLSSAVDRIEGDAEDGDVVDLYSDKGGWIARGILNSRSRIRVRLYTWKDEQPLDDAFWESRLRSALELRKQIGYDDREGATRLVFSEADGLSGLIVDRYRNDLVVQLTSLAMAQRLSTLVPLLIDLAQPRSIVARTDKSVAQAEGLENHTEGHVWGDPANEVTEVTEHGVRFRVDFAGGQKTGFYLDQKENRLAAASYAAGKRVLDVCCYTGDFPLLAAVQGQAREVLGIDTSNKAVEEARHNADLNGLSNVQFQSGNCFDELKRLSDAGEKFDMIVLDPPRFASNRRNLADALRAYHRLNRSAVDLLEPEGILVTCSCSGHVLREDFQDMLHGVCQKAHRDLQILEQRGASPDHPVRLSCPETEYLKCFICRVVD